MIFSEFFGKNRQSKTFFPERSSPRRLLFPKQQNEKHFGQRRTNANDQCICRTLLEKLQTASQLIVLIDQYEKNNNSQEGSENTSSGPSTATPSKSVPINLHSVRRRNYCSHNPFSLGPILQKKSCTLYDVVFYTSNMFCRQQVIETAANKTIKYKLQFKCLTPNTISAKVIR